MAFGVLAEALLRIEHKLDALLRVAPAPALPHPQLGFIGVQCPMCSQPIEYQVDVFNKVATRRCGCASGKIPPTFDLFPMNQGEKDANRRTEPDVVEVEVVGAEDSSRRGQGQSGSRRLVR